MYFNSYNIKITTRIFFVIVFIFFSTLHAKNPEKYNKAENIAGYLSGIILLNESKYGDSLKFLKKLDGLEETHNTFAIKYLYSLVNSGNFYQAFNFSKKIERDNLDNFESDLIIGIYYLKNSKYELSNKYFLKAQNRNSRTLLDDYISKTLDIWSNVENSNFEQSTYKLNQLDNRFENLKKIQNVFLNCFFKTKNTEALFDRLTTDNKTDFSRYNSFFAKYLESIGKNQQAKKIILQSLEKFPRNLLLNQYKIDLEKQQNKFNFNCQKEQDVVAEIFYIAANALSSQSMYQTSNFFLNLSKYLNKDFNTFDTLLAENFYKIDDLLNAKKIYEQLKKQGIAFKWYANKQIARILVDQNKKDRSLELMSKSFSDLIEKGIYATFDYAEFLKNNEQFEKSIKYYSDILFKINEKHPLYPDVTDGRGVSYERIGEWKKAEKDLLASLKVSPNQAYVINYLAYSWIEQGVKIEKSLEMLEKANKLKSNDPFIIDSLGWALFKLERYQESKRYLQTAVKLMPADPIVNDHYGDVLWKNGNKIQARYHWEYVLKLDEAEKDLKTKIEKKLLTGL